MHDAKETGRGLSSARIDGTAKPRAGFELVAEAKLHHSRLSQGAGITAKGSGIVHVARTLVHIKARSVCQVKDFPTKLNCVLLVIGHGPTLRQPHVDAKVAI